MAGEQGHVDMVLGNKGPDLEGPRMPVLGECDD